MLHYSFIHVSIVILIYNNGVNYLYGECESITRESLIGFNYNNKTYYYIKDEIGNIVSIISDGIEVVRYIYDGYGNTLVYEVNSNNELIINNDITFIGNINPYRYKDYYYDYESKLYYLNSRYYSSDIRRFISSDDILYIDSNIINGLNLYCYCSNNPIMYADPSGHAPGWLQCLAIGLAIVGAALVLGAITALTMGVGTTIMVTSMAGAVIHGAAVETLIGAGVGVVGGAIVGGALTDWSVEGVLTGAGIGFGALAIA